MKVSVVTSHRAQKSPSRGGAADESRSTKIF
nr:MAG TPA: hypothetical protein [Caudoviricetes sp.]